MRKREQKKTEDGRRKKKEKKKTRGPVAGARSMQLVNERVSEQAKSGGSRRVQRSGGSNWQQAAGQYFIFLEMIASAKKELHSA